MSSPFQVTHISHIYIKVYVSEQLSFLTHFFTFTKIEAVHNSQKSEVSTVMIWCCALTKAHHWVIMSCCFWVPPKRRTQFFTLTLWDAREDVLCLCVWMCLPLCLCACVCGWVGGCAWQLLISPAKRELWPSRGGWERPTRDRWLPVSPRSPYTHT